MADLTSDVSQPKKSNKEARVSMNGLQTASAIRFNKMSICLR